MLSVFVGIGRVSVKRGPDTWMADADGKMRIEKCGWKNKCGQQKK